MLGLRILCITSLAYGLRIQVHESQEQNIDPKPKYAFVTLVADDPGFIEGAQVLGRSLRTFAKENNMDMLLMYKGKLFEEDIAKQAGWNTMKVNPIKNPWDQGRFASTYNKLHVFNLTTYDRVIYVDADMVAINPEPIKYLLTTELQDNSLLAVPDCAAHFLKDRPGVDHEINTGLFVVKPSASLFDNLMQRIDHHKSVDGGDQGYFSNFFQGRVKLLPAKFNYIRASNCINSINRTESNQTESDGFYMLDERSVDAAKKTTLQQAEDLAEKDIQYGQVVFAHFHFQPKPWTCKDPYHCGATWDAGDTGIVSIAKQWRKWWL